MSIRDDWHKTITAYEKGELSRDSMPMAFGIALVYIAELERQLATPPTPHPFARLNDWLSENEPDIYWSGECEDTTAAILRVVEKYKSAPVIPLVAPEHTANCRTREYPEARDLDCPVCRKLIDAGARV